MSNYENVKGEMWRVMGQDDSDLISIINDNKNLYLSSF
jgi:hypothetical protein